MSSMAKIFVVVNLVLAVCVFGSAATLLGAQDDYKVALEETTGQFDTYKNEKSKEIDGLKNQVAQQTTAASDAVGAQRNAEAARDAAQQAANQLQTANQSLRSTMEKLSQEVGELRQVNSEYKNMVNTMSEESKTSTQEKLNAVKKYEEEVGNRVRLEQQVSQLQAQVEELSASKGDLEKSLRDARFWLAEYRKRHGDITGGSQGASGRVLTVKDNLVLISVGSSDQVRAGDIYHLRRGGTYVGQITIETVEKDSAVGNFDARFPGDGAPPQAGDVAYPDR